MKRVLAGLSAVILSAMAAQAADLPVKARVAAAPACSWCGFYVGVNAGYVTNDNSMSTVSAPTPDATLGVVPGVSEGLAALSTGAVSVGRKDSFIGGGQAGYNWVWGRFLAGVEADIQALSNTTAAGTVANTAVVVGVPVTVTQIGSMSTSDLGTLRGRVGFLADPKWLLYATGGLAYGNVGAANTLFQTGTNGFVGAGTASLTDTRTGWTAGGGVEWMIAPMWSVKAEYLHYDLGSVRFVNSPTSAFFLTPVFQTNSVSASYRGDIVRAGINFHFGGS